MHTPGAATFTRVTDSRVSSNSQYGHWDEVQKKWIPATQVPTSPASSGNQTAGYQHVYTEDEWNKLSKSQKKAIIKQQKKNHDEGTGMLSFFDRRRYGFGD